MLGFPILYFKGMRLMMFQLSGFYCRVSSKGSIRATTRDLQGYYNIGAEITTTASFGVPYYNYSLGPKTLF